jgi:hypothetical protein
MHFEAACRFTADSRQSNSVAVGRAARTAVYRQGFVTEHVDKHERTMAFAEIALGQIKGLSHEATPRHYEIWYPYVTG